MIQTGEPLSWLSRIRGVTSRLDFEADTLSQRHGKANQCSYYSENKTYSRVRDRNFSEF